MNKYLYFFGFVLAGFLALGMFQAKSGASKSKAEIAKLEANIAAIQKDISILRTEHAHLASRERIATLASERLGMAPARSYQMIEVDRAAEAFGPLIEYEDDQ
ncbi:cell division protein FtsL [Ponticaulis profundi]|uniref:Cell division protein FtsL n=1 Tax=Ponticaulis profundi TaxID=2665222 RepID=A0ABW1S581_9PROT|tara:strand:- start:312 stop:620 length:309 start_codon:yes stop_codon:yes gene_type:complete